MPHGPFARDTIFRNRLAKLPLHSYTPVYPGSCGETFGVRPQTFSIVQLSRLRARNFGLQLVRMTLFASYARSTIVLRGHLFISTYLARTSGARISSSSSVKTTATRRRAEPETHGKSEITSKDPTGLLRPRLASDPVLCTSRVMGHLGERRRRLSLARSRVPVCTRRLDRGEEAAARGLFHQDEFAQPQFLCSPLLRVRAVEPFKYGECVSLSLSLSTSSYLPISSG